MKRFLRFFSFCFNIYNKKFVKIKEPKMFGQIHTVVIAAKIQKYFKLRTTVSSKMLKTVTLLKIILFEFNAAHALKSHFMSVRYSITVIAMFFGYVHKR